MLFHEDVVPNILWSGEAYFKIDGEVNTNNRRIWAKERQRKIMPMNWNNRKISSTTVFFQAQFDESYSSQSHSDAQIVIRTKVKES